MAKLNPATTLPTSSQDALQIFDDRYAAERLIARPSTWVDELGEVSDTPALSTKYPMAFLALKYLEAKTNQDRFRTIGEKDVELTVVEYKDAVEIELMKLLTNTFSARHWENAPAAMLQAEQIFKLKLIADALVANTETCGWDGLALFADAHLCNPDDSESATFDNLQATPKDVTDLAVLEPEITAGFEVLDINGDPLGVQFDTIGVPRQKFQKLSMTLKQDFVATPAGTATMRNPFNDGSLNVVRMDQLTDVNDWYLFDSKLISRGVPPWIVAKLALPVAGFDDLGLRRYDPNNSDRAREKGVVGVGSHIYYGSKFLFPHAVRKVVGA